MHRIEWPDGSVEFHLGYGDWIRLLRANGFEVEDLIEFARRRRDDGLRVDDDGVGAPVAVRRGLEGAQARRRSAVRAGQMDTHECTAPGRASGCLFRQRFTHVAETALFGIGQRACQSPQTHAYGPVPKPVTQSEFTYYLTRRVLRILILSSVAR